MRAHALGAATRNKHGRGPRRIPTLSSSPAAQCKCAPDQKRPGSTARGTASRTVDLAGLIRHARRRIRCQLYQPELTHPLTERPDRTIGQLDGRRRPAVACSHSRTSNAVVMGPRQTLKVQGHHGGPGPPNCVLLALTDRLQRYFLRRFSWLRWAHCDSTAKNSSKSSARPD